VSKQTSRHEVNFIASLLIDRIVKCGISLQTVLNKARISVSAEQVLRTRGSDLSGTKMSALCKECHHALVNYMHGRFFDMDARMEEFKFACYTLMSCATLGEAIERIEIFNHMLKSSSIDVRMTVSGDLVRIVFTNVIVGNDIENIFLSNLLATRAWQRLLNWLVGDNMEMTRAYMTCSPPADPYVATALLHCPVEFAHANDAIEFPASFLRRAIARSYPDLVAMLGQFPFNCDTDDNFVGSLSERIRNIYSTCLDMHQPLPDVEQLAQNFGLSPSTFKRRLAEEGSSIGAIKDEWRRDRALRDLSSSSRTIEEIADGLGFSCGKTFRRAFGRWTRTSPTKYRSKVRASA
jgi:AraC-like DNA-binding protein